jgi:hypothetical protein
MRHFTCVIRDTVFHVGAMRACKRVYINIRIQKSRLNR